MIKKLRRQFIIIAMASMGAVLALIIIVINVSNYRSMMKTIKQRMAIVWDMEDGDMFSFPGRPGFDSDSDIEENAKSLPSSNDAENIDSESTESPAATESNMKPFRDDSKKPSEDGFLGRMNNESRFDTRYFVVDFDSDGNYSSSDVSRIASIDSDSAKSYAASVYEKKKTSGLTDGLYYEKSEDSDGSVTIIFLDVSRELSSFRSYLFISILTSAVGALAVYILILVFSRRVMKPVAESYEKQKRFITDASHEIKTPLAIIGANTEVIEMESGENEWTKSINHQIKRLSSLVEKMVFLSKMDEEGASLQMIDFDVSAAVLETADSFDAVAESKGFHYEKNIEENLSYHGDKDRIVQLTSLLLDNSMKYCSENGTIKISLSKGRKKGIIISVYNTCESISKGNNDVLFERFYRADESRNSKTGGHGIGLSVVRAIAEAHHGEAHAFSEDGKSILFTIKLN